MLRILISVLPCLLLSCAGSSHESTDGGSHSWTGEVEVHGALRAMFHEGQTGTMVSLGGMLPDPDLYAVGALADLSGEITIIAGKLYLSYPEGKEGTRTVKLSKSDAGATLLVTTQVAVWHPVTTRTPIRFEELDEAIGKLASAVGMNLDERFPFLLEGEFENLEWHVVDGSRLVAGGTSHKDHLAAAVQGRRDRSFARLVGFFSASDQGVFTHMDSRTHIHCVLPDPLTTGHVDNVTIPAGTTILFPKMEN